MKRSRSLAIVTGALVAGLALAACSSSSPGTTSGGGSTGGTTSGKASFDAGLTTVVNPSTKTGGTLTYGVAATP